MPPDSSFGELHHPGSQLDDIEGRRPPDACVRYCRPAGFPAASRHCPAPTDAASARSSGTPCRFSGGGTRRHCHHDDLRGHARARLTAPGRPGVPESPREASIAFGAKRWCLLTRVDLPLAAPSNRAGINQAGILSLATVVVASPIGAQGLGLDGLEALQLVIVGAKYPGKSSRMAACWQVRVARVKSPVERRGSSATGPE